MKLLDAKRNIEQYFLDNYSETAVHWAGMKFDTSKYQEWVYFEYVADFVADSGLDNTVYSQEGTIKISIIGKNPFRCSQIADIVIDLFKGKKIEKLFAGKVRVLTQNYVAEIDKTALELDVYLTTY